MQSRLSVSPKKTKFFLSRKSHFFFVQKVSFFWAEWDPVRGVLAGPGEQGCSFALVLPLLSSFGRLSGHFVFFLTLNPTHVRRQGEPTSPALTGGGSEASLLSVPGLGGDGCPQDSSSAADLLSPGIYRTAWDSLCAAPWCVRCLPALRPLLFPEGWGPCEVGMAVLVLLLGLL